MLINEQKELQKTKDLRDPLFASLLLFVRTFYKLRMCKEFVLGNPYPTCRELHYISICRQLMRVFRGELDLLVINVPPRYGKTELLIHFVAWCFARYPDCNFIYTSSSHSLAAKQSETVRDILQLREYYDLFRVKIKKTASAKDDFMTTENGGLYAAGLDGAILGRGAGIQNIQRFGGCIIIDDAHKEGEVHSPGTRQKVIDRYRGTLRSRRSNPKRTPIIFIGQCLHEEDLAAHLKKECEESKSKRKYHLKLKSLDDAGNALCPRLHTKEMLLEEKRINEYNFYSQYQQEPQAAGGMLYKEKDFALLEFEPKMIATFITADTAETENEANDATAFSFFGVYKADYKGEELGFLNVHWIDCVEMHVEPCELEDAFLRFHASCMRHTVKPQFAAIEKKSTGVSLGSALEYLPGLRIVKVPRGKGSGSKTTRFISMQRFIAQHRVSLPKYGSHTQMCLTHCGKITNNNTHAKDDICDTLYDGVRIGLIDQSYAILSGSDTQKEQQAIVKNLAKANQKRNNLRRGSRW